MKILHLSDTHGAPWAPIPRDVELVIHTGDLLPNLWHKRWAIGMPRFDVRAQPHYQLEHALENRAAWKENLADRPFVFIPGNHDFLGPERIEKALLDVGIDARNACDHFVVVNGFRFYGFAWIPSVSGEWCREVDERRIAEFLAPVREKLMAGEIDVLLTHAPPYGILDEVLLDENDEEGGTEHVGSASLTGLIEDGLAPRYWLFGHIHRCGGGVQVDRRTLFSNAATMRNRLILEERACSS